MQAIPEEEKTSLAAATVATSIASSAGNPMAKPAVPIEESDPTSNRLSSASARPSNVQRSSNASSRVSTASSASNRFSLHGLDPLAVTKALKSEVKHWKDRYYDQQHEMQNRIDTLEQENEDLLQEQDILNDRHQSHTEELRYMQNEFLCIKGHLQKLRKDMESLDGLLVEQQLQQSKKKLTREEHQLAEKVEEAIFKVKERQEFTCVFMDNTIASIDEILNEYIPDKVEYKVVEDHKTIQQLAEEAKLREMREEEELRKRRELERQLLEQEKEIHEADFGGSDFTSDSGDFLSMSDNNIMNIDEEQISELGIETPAMREAKLSHETQNLFKEQQKLFAKYIKESRSDQATSQSSSGTRFKGWFEEKREKWLEEENMKDLRRKKRQSQAVMMHKVKQMHSDAFHKVTEIKLHHFEQGQQEKDRKSQLEGISEDESSFKSARDHSPPPKRKEEEVLSKLEEEMRFSLTKGDLNDFFKQYKSTHTVMMEGNQKAGTPSRGTPRQESRGFFGLLGFGAKSEKEMSC